MTELRYPIGLQSFSEIRKGGYVYVDKTAYIHDLVASGKYFFLSRPRRFGKSLFISTLEAFFQGKRELFEGLAIMEYEYGWEARPVLHLDLTGRNYKDENSLRAHLDEYLRRWEALYGNGKCDCETEERFRYIIESAYAMTGRKVVILVDEYDKPLLDTVDDERLQTVYRSELKALYANLKRMDSFIEFAMLTGVTKFGKLSIFSDINNLKDISLRKAYSSICGVTEDELRRYFHAGTAALAQEHDMTEEEAYARLKQCYDGYHFAPDSPDIYNPFSILNALDDRSFGKYWFATGTPTFLIKMIWRSRMDLRKVNDMNVKLDNLGDVSYDLSKLEALLYQSGYMTIKSYNPRFDTVRLGYPNREVEEGFLEQLMQLYTSNRMGRTSFDIEMFVEEVETGDAEGFMQRLQSLFAEYHYDQIDIGHLELHYRNVIYLVMKLMGLYTEAELRTSDGRIDLMVSSDRYVYVFEFKIDRSAEEAMAQINLKEYMLPFRKDGRTLVKIGANFSNRLRRLDSWIIERV